MILDVKNEIKPIFAIRQHYTERKISQSRRIIFLILILPSIITCDKRHFETYKEDAKLAVFYEKI